MVVDGTGHADLIGGGCFAERMIDSFRNRPPAASTKPRFDQIMGEMI